MAEREIDKLLAKVPAAKRTIAGNPPPPPRREVPAPPPLPSLPPEPKRSITPNGTRLMANYIDPPELTQRSREVIEQHGGTLEESPRSTMTGGFYRWETPWYKTAKGVAIAVPVIVAALSALTPAVFVPVIRAIREPWEGAKVADISAAKKAGEECQVAVASERKATLAREEALAERIEAAETKTSEVARGLPVVKPDPNRAPKSR